MEQKIPQYLVLALTLFCTLAVGIPAALPRVLAGLSRGI